MPFLKNATSLTVVICRSAGSAPPTGNNMQSRGLRFGGREVSHSIEPTDAENKSTTRRAKNCSAYTRQSRPNFENAPVYTYTCSPDRCVCIHHVIRLSHHLSAVQNGGEVIACQRVILRDIDLRK